jgi:PAS domain S-box-containing protein
MSHDTPLFSVPDERPKPDIPPAMLERWQTIVDLMADLIGAVDGLITRVHATELEAFVVSRNPENMFEAGHRVQLQAGYYCETVMNRREMLHVSDARTDPRWQDAPEIEHGLVAYLGFPLTWPDGEMFGTICMHDKQEQHYSEQAQRLLDQFRASVEADLRTLVQMEDLRRMEADLRASQALYRALVEHYPNGMVHLFDHELRYVLAGGSGLATLGADAGDLQGRTIWDVLPEDVAQEVAPHYCAALRGTPHSFELSLGEQIFRVETAPVQPPGRETTLGLAVLQNITQLKQAEQREMQLTLERERVRLLSAFIRDVSHEFRTPLASIRTTNYMLRRLCDEETFGKYLDRIDMQVEQLTTLVENLLLMFRLDSDPNFQIAPRDVNSIVQQIAQNRQHGAANKQIDLITTLEPDLPALPADDIYLSEALKRIVDNALRYTDAGGTVTISTRREDGWLAVSVQDTGSGIDPDALPHIFDRFFRDDDARTTRGPGLGLPIAARIVELHGGQIIVDSTPGAGSCFTVMLPLGAA